MIEASNHLDDPFRTAHLEGIRRAGGMGLGEVEFLHICSVGLTAFLALTMMFGWMGAAGLLIAGAATFLVIIGLFVARALAPLIGDFYRQMAYREKFLIFLAHMSLVLIPWVTRQAPLNIMLVAFLIVLSFQGIDRLFHARLTATLWLMAILANFMSGEAIPPSTALAFGLASLLSIRLCHLRYRLEQYGGERQAIEAWPLVARSIWLLLPVAMAGGAVSFVTPLVIEPRTVQIDYRPRMDRLAGGPNGISLGTTFWMAIGLVILIVATIVGLNLLEKLLRRRSRPIVEDGTSIVGSSRVYTAAGEADVAMRESTDAGPRGRIIERLSWLSRRLETHGMGRPAHQTISEWLGVRSDTEDIDRLFAKACYSPLPITAEDAGRFEELTGALVSDSPERAGDGPAPG